MKRNIISVKNLVKRYDEKIVLDHFNFELKKGEIVGLLGPNGSGKTTAINTILSLLSYDKGEIKIFDKSLKFNSYDLKARIGLVPQEMAVFSNLKVYENIDYFCSLYIADNKKRKKLIEETIDFVKLDEFRNYLPNKLSGGVRRRLNIACGIAHKPDLIIMDEPTANIDAQSRDFILMGCKKLKENGTSILYTSHYLEELEIIADRTYIIDKGSNLIDGSLDELREKSGVAEKIILGTVLSDDISTKFHKIKNLNSYEKLDANKYSLSFSKRDTEKSSIEIIIDFLKQEKIDYNLLSSSKSSLNDIFLEITGRGLRD